MQFNLMELNAQNLSTYWFKDGIADSAFYRTDIISFKCNGGVSYSGIIDTTIIDSIVFNNNRRDKANDVFFKSTSTLPQRLIAAQSIYNSGQVEFIYLNVFKNNNLTISTSKRYTIDNLVLVNFVNNYPSTTDINLFMTQFNLTLYSQPSALLPNQTNGPSYTYIFEAHIPTVASGSMDAEYAVKLIRDIYLNSNLPVANVSPNIIQTQYKEVAIGDNDEPVDSEIKTYTTCEGLDDFWSDYQWYIDNDGYNESTITQSNCGPNNIDAKIGADAKICDCWSAGLSGQGIRVGIIAPGDICDIHPDLTNQLFNEKWDCTVNPVIPLVPAIGPGYMTWNGTLMQMAGLIGATKHNTIGIAGIAQNVNVVPFKVGEFDNNTGILSVSSANIIAALQHALIEPNQVDIIVLDYVSEFEDINIKKEFYKHHTLGRSVGNESGLGTIIIAPAGHTTVTATANNILPNYPAKYNLDESVGFEQPEVIGVIASNRWDKLEIGEFKCNQPFVNGYYANETWPAYYNSTYDVAAPGGPFFSLQGDQYYGRNWDFGLTQDANTIAIVGGVAALLLESNKTQTDVQMLQRIRDGADKVGNYTYFGFFNKSPELGGGRINCISSKNYLPTSITNTENTINPIVINNATYWQIDNLPIEMNVKELKVFNVAGQLVSTQKFINNKTSLQINNEELPKGIYLIQLLAIKNCFTIKANK